MDQNTIIIIVIVCVACLGIGLTVFFMMKKNKKGSGSGCKKNCSNKNCGSDGCGGICGVCSGSGQSCNNGSCSGAPPSGLLGGGRKAEVSLCCTGCPCSDGPSQECIDCLIRKDNCGQTPTCNLKQHSKDSSGCQDLYNKYCTDE